MTAGLEAKSDQKQTVNGLTSCALLSCVLRSRSRVRESIATHDRRRPNRDDNDDVFVSVGAQQQQQLWCKKYRIYITGVAVGPKMDIQGGPKKVSHYQESSLNRVTNRQCGYIYHQFW